MPETAPAAREKLTQLKQLGILAFQADALVGLSELENSPKINLDNTIAKAVGVPLDDMLIKMTARVVIGLKGGPIERTIANRLDQADFIREGGVPQLRDSKNRFVFPITTLQFFGISSVKSETIPQDFYPLFKGRIKDNLGDDIKEMIAKKQRMNEADLESTKLLITCGVDAPEIRNLSSRLKPKILANCKQSGIQDIDPEFHALLNQETEKARVQILSKVSQSAEVMNELADFLHQYVSQHIDLVLQYAHGNLDYNLEIYMRRISQGVDTD